MLNMVSLDGFFEGPEGEIYWHNVDEGFNLFAIEQFRTLDTVLFGRMTYLLMASYWSSPAALAEDPQTAALMNKTQKFVFSNTLQKADWMNTRLISGNATAEINKLKELPGMDMIIFGSGVLVSSLAQAGLIDEYRLMVNPIILGGGRPLFTGFKQHILLKLAASRTFKSGNVLLTYKPL